MTASKLGLHSLPTELKQQIVRCCRDQDVLLASAFEKVLDDRGEANDLHMKRDDTLHRAVLANRSLTSLAAVSREWNELVAPVLFESLPLSRLWGDHFQTRVLPRRGHHFVRVVGAWKRGDARNIGCSYAQDLADALAQLPNLIHLDTPDLVRAIRAGRESLLRNAEANELEPEFITTRMLEFDAREEAIVGLLGRAESIMHPEVTPQDLLASFRGVSGANLRQLAFTSRAGTSEPSDFASILEHFPILELLEIKLELFNLRGALHPILSAKPLPTSAPRPKLRELVLTASYDGAQFYFGNVVPSLAPLIHLAQPFAETLQVLTLDIHRDDDFDPHVEPDNSDLEHYINDDTPLAFTTAFPLLRRLILRGLTSAFNRLLRSIDTTTLPALESCLFFNSRAPAHNCEHAAVVVDFAEAASRVPGFKVGQSPPRSFESMTDRLAGWVRQRDADRGPSLFPFRLPRESPWPEPVLHPHSRVDPTALSDRLRVTIEHLHEWYRRACDAQDPDALVQIREALERVDANKVVVKAWTAGGGAPTA